MEETELTCKCEDADCKFCEEDGECEMSPEVRDDPILMEKIQSTFETMRSVAKAHNIPHFLTRVEHQGRIYKLHYEKK